MDPSTAQTATVCIAGGGPAGVMLGLLLARAGVDVVVLEKHDDFLHDFRDDTVHPSTLEVLAELGLAERVLALPHRRAYTVDLVRDGIRSQIAEFRRLDLRHPYIAFIPQWDLLDLLAGEASRHANFRLRMGAHVYGLLHEHGRVVGVRYRDDDGEHEMRSPLTVAADGRHSMVRRAAALRPRELAAPVDVVMFRVSRRDIDPDGCYQIHMTAGGSAVVINRATYWNIAFPVRKDRHDRLRARGMGALRDEVSGLVPFLADRVDELTGFDQIRFLDVRVNRLQRWHLPGLLCIGDAAHAMSPMGGVGINLAVQDAVAAANVLAAPLIAAQRHGTAIPESAVAAVQRRRWLPTVTTQTAQRLVQRHGVERVLDGRGTRDYRWMLRSGLVRTVVSRLVGVGVQPEHVRSPQLADVLECPAVATPR